jgi:hypothetical protein
MTEGATEPALFDCETKDGDIQAYVVKFHGQLQSRVVCELIAALLGHYFGIPIPPVAVVDIDPRLVPYILDNTVRERLTRDPGPHFGSQFKTGGYDPLPRGFLLTYDQVPQAFDIFLFDLLIQNPDRSLVIGKPNILYDGERFLVYDHEKAFSFIYDVGPSPLPWELRNLDFPRNHIFYAQLFRYSRNHELPFETFMNRLESLQDTFLNDMVDAIPSSWQNPTNTGKIVAHLKMARENIVEFEQGVREVLV